jgi:hypothetical protein
MRNFYKVAGAVAALIKLGLNTKSLSNGNNPNLKKEGVSNQWLGQRIAPFLAKAKYQRKHISPEQVNAAFAKAQEIRLNHQLTLGGKKLRNATVRKDIANIRNELHKG